MVLYTGTKRKAGEKISGALEKRLTHMPFTHAFTGSNPVQVTIRKLIQELSWIFYLYIILLVLYDKAPCIG